MITILLIVRDWKARAFIRAQLLEEGYEVSSTEDLGQAIARLCGAALRPSLIVLDTVGQDIDPSGWANLQALTDHAPLIICTGVYELNSLDLPEASAVKVLVRPFTVGEVVEAVKALLPLPVSG